MKTQYVKPILVMLFIVLFANLCGCTNEMNNPTENIESINEISNYMEVSNESIQSIVDQICDDYNQEATSYEDALNSLEEIRDNLDDQSKRSIVTSGITLLSELKTSKTNYNHGIEYMEKGAFSDYEKAIEYFESVIEEDINYEDAQGKLSETCKLYYDGMSEKAENYYNEGEYLYAIDTYKIIGNTLGNDYNNTSDRISEIKKDYISIEEAENYMSEGKFAEAKALINDCIDYVGVSSELTQEKNRIEDCTPVDLMSLTSFWHDQGSFSQIGYEWEDNTGNIWNSGLIVGCINGEKQIAYLVDKKYDTFTGTFALSANNKNMKYEKGNYVYLKIYGDGVLLYESDYLSGGIRPIDFSIDIKNVDELVIGVYAHRDSVFTLKVAITNPTLSKNLQ